jgi:hypothetical protein
MIIQIPIPQISANTRNTLEYPQYPRYPRVLANTRNTSEYPRIPAIRAMSAAYKKGEGAVYAGIDCCIIRKTLYSRNTRISVWNRVCFFYSKFRVKSNRPSYETKSMFEFKWEKIWEEFREQKLETQIFFRFFFLKYSWMNDKMMIQISGNIFW